MGSRQVDTAVIAPLMGSMMEMAVQTITTVRTTSMACICTKRRTVSTSLVQRWTRSPVCTPT